MGGCRLIKCQINPLNDGFNNLGKRENESYKIPKGWMALGFKVFNKYRGDCLLDMNNIQDDWVVAYHGVGKGHLAEEVLGILGEIIGRGFKTGKRQVHKKCDDQFHPGQNVGEGIYCTPSIRVAEGFAGVCKIRRKKYKTVIMVRVNPNARRHCNSCEESKDYNYWVVNATPEEIRPYRILYKRC